MRGPATPRYGRTCYLPLWYGGFRLGEALRLSWDYDALLSVRLEESAVMFYADGHKSGIDQLWPMPPELEELLWSLETGERRGVVFQLGMQIDRASRVISSIGRRAGIRTGEGERKRTVKEGKKKVRKLVPVTHFATAHDLRRSFGTRWAKALFPAELQLIMRHADIETTMQYYVDLPAGDVAKKMREVVGDHFGDQRVLVTKSRDTKKP